MKRTETIESPNWTGQQEVRAALAAGPGISSSNIPLDAEGMGGMINMKITKRTQSKNGKVL